MKHNYSKLRGRIVEVYGTQYKFVEAMGISEKSIINKLQGKVGFKQHEIHKACNLLKIAPTDIGKYFFNFDVTKHEGGQAQ